MSDLFKVKMDLKNQAKQIRELKFDPDLSKKEVQGLIKLHDKINKKYVFYEKYLETIKKERR